MLTDELMQLGQKILAELNSDRSSTTQKWMAHYIAELMKRAEGSAKAEFREKAEKECADLILKLWDLEKEKAKIRVRASIDARFDEIYEKRPNSDEIKKLIEHPESAHELEDQTSKDIILFSLHDVESDLLRFRIIGDAIGSLDRDLATDELLQEADKYIQVFEITVRHLKDIWNQAEGISIEDLAGIQSFVSLQIRKIQQIRNYLIDE